MLPDDPRHGTNAGYINGCRDECCRAAHATYKRDRRARTYLARGPLTVPAIGFHRRVEALMYLGWSMEEISNALGHHRSWCSQTLRHPVIFRDTHVAMDALFRRWCMTVPPAKPIRSRIRNMARHRGYAPALAWNDIDNPDEKPKGMDSGRSDVNVIRAHELEHLALMGDNLAAASRALGLTEDTIWKWCDRQGRLDLYERLAARSRTKENQYTTKGAA